MGKLLVSGGADSKLTVWQDNTLQVEEEQRAKEAETILLDQKLGNHLRHKEYGKALEIAFQVDKPMQALKVLSAVIEQDIQRGVGSGLRSLQSHARTWDMERVAQVLKSCRDWNTRARNAHIAMMVVKAIVTTISVHQLTSAKNEIPEILAGIIPYAERHFDRLDRLHSNSYLLDFALTGLGALDASDNSESEQEFANWEASSKLVLCGWTNPGGRQGCDRKGQG
jgi:U3 small nucleolar RNA-associated protein 13